jgi:uncharacterized protein (DUF488 family)
MPATSIQNKDSPKGPAIHTIGHSDHTVEAFIELLRRYGITLLVDVRSQPYSRWVHQFNRELLIQDLSAAGIAYRYMGDALGGRPADPSLYDPGEERPDYQRMEQSPKYQAGIEELLALAADSSTVVMCSEGEHYHCHRHLLIAQTLLERGARVLHMQPDGTAVPGSPIPRQLSLFG